MQMTYFFSDSHTSIASTLEVISNFSNISGYKINLTKSLLFPIDQAAYLNYNPYLF